MKRENISIYNDAPIIYIQCCQNCYYHAWCSRHDQNKYIEHFNTLKKKLETYIPEIAILKNHIPDHYKKLNPRLLEDNKYYDQEKDEIIQYPRSGAFEICVNDILIFSKIQSNFWPSHSRIIQIIQTIIEQIRRGGQIQKFSVENRLYNDHDYLFKKTYRKLIKKEIDFLKESLDKTIDIPFKLKQKEVIKKPIKKLATSLQKQRQNNLNVAKISPRDSYNYQRRGEINQSILTTSRVKNLSNSRGYTNNITIDNYYDNYFAKQQNYGRIIIQDPKLRPPSRANNLSQKEIEQLQNVIKTKNRKSRISRNSIVEQQKSNLNEQSVQQSRKKIKLQPIKSAKKKEDEQNEIFQKIIQGIKEQKSSQRLRKMSQNKNKNESSRKKVINKNPTDQYTSQFEFDQKNTKQQNKQSKKNNKQIKNLKQSHQSKQIQTQITLQNIKDSPISKIIDPTSGNRLSSPQSNVLQSHQISNFSNSIKFQPGQIQVGE